jgi:hypothetical protein
MTDEGKDIYRLVDRPADFADSIAYDAGFEVPQIDDTAPDGTIEYYFASCNVTAAVSQVDTKGNALIRIWAGEGAMLIGLAFQQINLMSQRAIAGLVRELAETHPDVTDWRELVKNVAWRTAKAASTIDLLQGVGKPPETMRQSFRLFPIVHEGEPTTIYCPGGVGKSYLAVFCACLVQFDIDGFTDTTGGKLWSPTQGNALYLDWESTHRDHERRTWAVKRGLGLDHHGEFLYLHCKQPLTAIVSDIQTVIKSRDITFVIIDSQMAAADFGPDIGQNATRFYNAVRQLECSTLILDHVSKAAMSTAADSTNNTGPHGSVVKANRSRQQYELFKHQVPGQSYTDLSLKHRKNNEGPLGEDFGIRISFVPHEETGHLDRVTFTHFEVSEHPTMSQTLPVWKRAWECLTTPRTLEEINEFMPDVGEKTLKAMMYRYKDRFTRMGDHWSRLAGEK